jgi:hypothetical protein
MIPAGPRALGDAGVPGTGTFGALVLVATRASVVRQTVVAVTGDTRSSAKQVTRKATDPAVRVKHANVLATQNPSTQKAIEANFLIEAL